MAKHRSVKTILYNTIHRNKKTVEQLADEIGISASYLYRSGLPLDESGVKFPVDYLIPLMRATKNYELLEHLANLCGYLLVREPRFRGGKRDEIDVVDEFQDATTKAVRSLKEFFNEPTTEHFELVTRMLYEVMQQSANAKRFCEKSFSNQLELDI